MDIKEEKSYLTEDKKVINGKFRQSNASNPAKQAKFHKNHTNPFFKRLLMLVHKELIKTRKDYRTFTKFQPEDIF